MGNIISKLNTINFEHEFNLDTAERKRIARGAFAKKGSRGPRSCTLPCDNLTQKQWEAKCSEVFSVSLKGMMTWSQYNHLDSEYQTIYLNYLLSIGGNNNTIADMFNLVGNPDVRTDINVTADMIQKERRKHRIGPPELTGAPEAMADNFSDWVCSQIDKNDAKMKTEAKQMGSKKKVTHSLTPEQKALAVPDVFYKNLIKYMTIHSSNIVRDYDKVQKDTVIILNRLQRKSKNEIHTDLQNIHLIINRVDFIDWLISSPRRGNLFQQELIANGIPLAYIEDERTGLDIDFYQRGKIPNDYKDHRIPVLAIDINKIPEPYRRSIFDVLCQRYSVNTMNKLFHYNKEEINVAPATLDEHVTSVVEEVKTKIAEEKKVEEETQMNTKPVTYVDPSEDVEDIPGFSLECAIKNSGLDIKSLDVQIHGTANLKGSKKELIEQFTKYVNGLNLTEVEIKF